MSYQGPLIEDGVEPGGAVLYTCLVICSSIYNIRVQMKVTLRALSETQHCGTGE